MTKFRLNEQSGFSIMIAVIAVVVASVLVFTAIKVSESDKPSENIKTETNNINEQAQSIATEKKYLEITEWGIKIPLTENTHSASYTFGEHSSKLLVSIEGDVDGSCREQAYISRAVDPSTQLEEWRGMMRVPEEGGYKIGNAYYFIEGSQFACTEDEMVLARANAVRDDFLKQRLAIEPL